MVRGMNKYNLIHKNLKHEDWKLIIHLDNNYIQACAYKLTLVVMMEPV